MANKIPEAAYSDLFLYDGKQFDPVEFVKRLDTALAVHRTAYPKSAVYEIPAVRYEHTFEYDGHTYTHIAEHSGYNMSDKLLCDGVPNARAWMSVVNQVTKANPALFPHQYRPIFGLNYAEYARGKGPTFTVKENLDTLSDTLGRFATLRGFPAGTPADDDQLIYSFANEAIPTMTKNACDRINGQFPGSAVINAHGDLCFAPDLCQDILGKACRDVSHLFHNSALEGMQKFAEKVNTEYEHAVENGDIVPNNDLER